MQYVLSLTRAAAESVFIQYNAFQQICQYSCIGLDNGLAQFSRQANLWTYRG